MTKKYKETETKEQRDDTNYSESVRLNDFILPLSFLRLICKASSIFKPNLKLALSIILKERESYDLKHVVVECRSFKRWDL